MKHKAMNFVQNDAQTIKYSLIVAVHNLRDIE